MTQLTGVEEAKALSHRKTELRGERRALVMLKHHLETGADIDEVIETICKQLDKVEQQLAIAEADSWPDLPLATTE